MGRDMQSAVSVHAWTNTSVYRMLVALEDGLRTQEVSSGAPKTVTHSDGSSTILR